MATTTTVRYPWLLPTDDPDYHPFYGFHRPMGSREYSRALSALSRRFMRARAARLAALANGGA